MFDSEYFNLGYLDTLSYRDTVIHRLDPRAKLIATVLFIVTVVSFPKYEIAGLLPFFLFPVLLFSLADVPVKFILKKVLLVSSFAVFIGIFNPVIDRRIVYSLLGVPVSGGWISFLSIMLKFFSRSPLPCCLSPRPRSPAYAMPFRNSACPKYSSPNSSSSIDIFLY